MLIQADARDLPDPPFETGMAQCCVTSPPYPWSRRYTTDPREIGTGSLWKYIADIWEVGQQLHRVLDDLSVWWLVLGDAMSGTGGSGGDWYNSPLRKDAPKWRAHRRDHDREYGQWILAPQAVALKLQARLATSTRGWYVRSYIIWDKTYPKPESAAYARRPGMQYEVILMLTKVPPKGKHRWNSDYLLSLPRGEQGDVWHIPPERNKTKTNAAFPIELPLRCISLSTAPGDLVIDPFHGSGTTAQVAEMLGRRYMGCDINA